MTTPPSKDSAVAPKVAAESRRAEDPAPEQDRQRYVWLVIALLAGVALALAVPGFVADPDAVEPTLAALLLLPLFVVAEVVVIHLPTQRNAHGYTLREVPAVLGLIFLAPQQYVAVYVVGAVFALLAWTRMRGVKLAFNAALFAFEATIGVYLYHLVLQGGDPLGPWGWAAALGAVLTTDLISAAAVTSVISITEGAFDNGVLREALRSGLAAACINTCVALLVATIVTVRPEAVVLVTVVVVLLVLGYRVYIVLARGHARTQLLYRFVDRTAAPQAMGDVVSVVLGETAELMHAEEAYLVELGEGGSVAEVRCHARAGERVETSVVGVDQEPRPWWFDAVEGESVLLPSGADHTSSAEEPVAERASGVPDAPRDAIAAPLRGSAHVRAVLIVCNRSFEKETFGPDDLQVFETLAAHAAVAMDRASTVHHLERLVDQRAHDALHDPLSGLPNRRAFNEALARSMAEGTADVAAGRGGVVLLLDLDDFKDVNDTLGHSAGDRLINVSGDRLRDRAHGLVARLGGDEFAVLLPGMTLAEGLDHARELHDELSKPVPLDNVELVVSASIGVTEIDSASSTAEELLAQADVAMYTAKADRSGVAVYRPEAGDSTARRLTLAADLPAALQGGHLHLWYQPQADARTGVVTGFEALVRWKHPIFGMVPPPEIIAVAQRTGRVRQLTDDLLRQALLARKSWERAGHDLAVSVNVTPGDIADPALVTRVQHELTETGTPPHGLVLEITESDAMKDPERSLATLAALTDHGVTVSVDDFGTGYSSLAYLDRLPVSEVKIDQSFVMRLEQGAADSTIVSATIGLAHDLGLRVVAEGVESELSRRLVLDLGVDIVQGYGLGRPMQTDQVLPWLAEHPTVMRNGQLATAG